MMRKSKRLPRFGLGVAAMFALASPAQAFQRVEFTQKAEVEKIEVTETGQRSVTYAEPKVVVPGDRIRYRLELDNRTSEPATGLKFVNPLEPEVAFAGTEDTDGFSVSVDGGTTYGTLDTLTVSIEGAAPRPASAADVTHLRWVLAEPLAPGKTKSVSFFGVIR